VVEDPTILDSLIAQAVPGGRVPDRLPNAGFERASLGRAILMVDCGEPETPYESAHISPLAFEFSYAKDRIFVACGSHVGAPEWNAVMRATAAHCTVIMDQQDAGTRKSGILGSSSAQNYILSRRQNGKNIEILGRHGGYHTLGISHERHLLLCENGECLQGEDILHRAGRAGHGLEFAVRFHLHPRVMVSLIRQGQAALLRLPNGMGWRFQAQNMSVDLEDSVYIPDGLNPRKTHQLVLRGTITELHTSIFWQLKRETMAHTPAKKVQNQQIRFT
jgi:uncharacterized heparinase superfamily protein